MKDLEYSMVDVSLAILKYSKGRWSPEEIITFAYTLENFHLEENEDPKPTLVSIKGGKKDAEQEQESSTETE